MPQQRMRMGLCLGADLSPGAVFARLLKLYLPRVDRDRLGMALHESGVSERQIMARYPTGVGKRSAA
jgi:hypothetical protein